MKAVSESPGSNLSRVPLAQLVQNIGDIILGQEDGSATTPSQHADACKRLRETLLQVIDVGVASPETTRKELGAVIQLLKLTLEKVPHWLAGDTPMLLLQLVDRFVPIIVLCEGQDMMKQAYECLGSIIGTLYEMDAQQLYNVALRMQRCLEGTCSDPFSRIAGI